MNLKKFMNKTNIIVCALLIMLISLLVYEQVAPKQVKVDSAKLTAPITVESNNITEVQEEVPAEPIEYYPSETEELIHGEFTLEEMQLWYAMTAAESYGMCDKAQRLTAIVPYNRKLSPNFPDTLEGVIYQKKPTLQYACTVNGMLQKYKDIYNGEADYLSDKEFDELERVAENVNYVAANKDEYPRKLVYQAMFAQGISYDVIEGEYFGLEP